MKGKSRSRMYQCDTNPIEMQLTYEMFETHKWNVLNARIKIEISNNCFSFKMGDDINWKVRTITHNMPYPISKFDWACLQSGRFFSSFHWVKKKRLLFSICPSEQTKYMIAQPNLSFTYIFLGMHRHMCVCMCRYGIFLLFFLCLCFLLLFAKQ